MIRTFGVQPSQLPPNMYAAVRFPVLARLDAWTGDGRLIESDGFSTRDLPLSIRMQERESYGHEGAVVTGALHEVTIDPVSGVASGRGFLLDTEEGRKHALYIATQSMRGNSIDIADADVRLDWGEDFDLKIIFTRANIAATTGVGTPAFADARIEMDEEITAAALTRVGEIMASIEANPMEELVWEYEPYKINIIASPRLEEISAELLASGIVQLSEAFFRPESERLQKLVVTAEGQVYGHLGSWNSCHDGIEGQCVMIPRPHDSYASFNKAGVLTERGIVETGPIFAYGGHRRAAGRPSLDEAYGGIENAWADVRITEGIHGPWISGIVRPGVDEHTVYAARASRVSGHWVNGSLKAIVSVNGEGFEVPGTGEIDILPELAAGFAFSISPDGQVAELVASFPPCAEEPDIAPPVQSWPLNGVGNWNVDLGNGAMTYTIPANVLSVSTGTIAVPAASVTITPGEPVEASTEDDELTTMLLYELLAED